MHDVGCDRVGHETDVAAQGGPQALQLGVGPGQGMCRLVGAHSPTLLVGGRAGEAAHLDLDELAQLAGQVVDVDPGAAVHVRRELVGQDQGPHRPLA